MKWWKKFWRLRKQNDVIKVILLFFAFGIAFLSNAIYNSILLYQMSQSHAEYILSGSTDSSNLNAALEEIRKLEDVTATSRQMDIPVTLQYQGSETTFTCVLLSEKYIETAYGIKESGATKIFYVNQSAYEQLKQDSDNTHALEHAIENNSLLVSYNMESQPKFSTGNQDGSTNAVPTPAKCTAKVVLAEQNMPDFPYVFCSSNGFDMTKDIADIRVYVSKQKVDNENAKKLQDLGFAIENAEIVSEVEYIQNLVASKIRHGIATTLLCLACMTALWKYGYASSARHCHV